MASLPVFDDVQIADQLSRFLDARMALRFGTSRVLIELDARREAID